MLSNKFTSRVTGRRHGGFHRLPPKKKEKKIENLNFLGCCRIITELVNGIRHNMAHLYDLSGLISSLDIVLALTKVKSVVYSYCTFTTLVQL